MFNFVLKMNFHEDKINKALVGDVNGSLSTVFVDLISGICNHNCIFCDGKYSKIEKKMFSRKRLIAMVEELVFLKVESVIIIGEGGDSLLNPHFKSFADALIDNHIHVGIYTNGNIHNQEIFDTLSKFDFVRVSLDAGTTDTYGIVHGCSAGTSDTSFAKACDFISTLSKMNNPEVGVSFVVIPKNIFEINKAAKVAKYCGADYFELKPFYEPDYKVTGGLMPNFRRALKVQLEQCVDLIDDTFSIILNNQIKQFVNGKDNVGEITRLRDSRPCITCRLRMVVSPTGCYLCTPHRSKINFRFGNPAKKSLVKIWNNREHQKLLKNPCALRCTYDKQNEIMLKMIKNKEVFKAKNIVTGLEKDAQHSFL